MGLETWQWPLAIVGAMLIGLSKTGIPGMGIFGVALFALVIHPARDATGLVLPILIACDFVAVKSYHRHAVWSHLWRLFPWAASGIVVGYLTMDHLGDTQINKLIGVIFLVMVGLHLWRKYKVKDDNVPHGIAFVAFMGLLAGFTTQVANAAGPVMVLYLLAMQLPKMEFIGTGAWYFLILNVFKVPFHIDLGTINPHSLLLDAALIPVAWIGALGGRKILPRINQRLFENIALAFALVAGLKLLLT